ncbi:hypothetical protein HanIR_Chr02g0066151 [Helianthus annuus]|nr:hypothetical protein HanIR_Chr02g0066151 [Helianthus annuus]
MVSTALIASSATERYTEINSLVSGAAMSGWEARCCLIWLKASSASSVHLKYFLSEQPLSILKKGKEVSANFEVKRFKAASFPFKLSTSFLLLGGLVSRTAFTLFGLALMLCFPTICPRNFPSSNPNEHFSRLSFMLTFLRFLKVSWMSSSI